MGLGPRDPRPKRKKHNGFLESYLYGEEEEDIVGDDGNSEDQDLD
jgi:hypothetical protein